METETRTVQDTGDLFQQLGDGYDQTQGGPRGGKEDKRNQVG